MRRAVWVGILFGLVLGWNGALCGQAVSLDSNKFVAARAARAAAPMRPIGKSASGIPGNLEKAAKGQDDTKGKGASNEPAPAPPAPPAPVMYVTMYTPEAKVPSLAFEDPKEIHVGMAADELTRRFGPPGMEVSGASKRTVTYFGKEGIFQLDLQDDKVVSIAPTRPRPATFALPGA